MDDWIKYSNNLDYAETHTFEAPAATGYYRYKWIVTFETDQFPYYKNTSSILLNRTGNKWTFTFSDGQGKTLPMPRADWVYGYVYQREPNLSYKYYATYAEKTGIVLDPSLYEVHHIRPLAYGGDNSYYNLIHLPKTLHPSVSGWFNGY